MRHMLKSNVLPHTRVGLSGHIVGENIFLMTYFVYANITGSHKAVLIHRFALA